MVLTSGWIVLSSSGHFLCAVPILPHRKNIEVEQLQFYVVKVSTFPNFKENSEDGSATVNTSGRTKLGASSETTLPR